VILVIFEHLFFPMVEQQNSVVGYLTHTSLLTVHSMQ